MNIILLILGVFLTLFSIILIIINLGNSSNSHVDNENENGVYTYNLDTKPKKNLSKEKNIVHEIINDKEDRQVEKEREILLKDLEETESFEEEYKANFVDTINTTSNPTSEIIRMHKEGLKANEIAKKLDKGIREIEIILKVNKIKD